MRLWMVWRIPVASAPLEPRAPVLQRHAPVPVEVPVEPRQFRTGAYFARSELFDGLEAAFRSDYLYDVGGRFVIDLLGALWKVEWIGIGGGYFWNDKFSGWTVGVDVRMKF